MGLVKIFSRYNTDEFSPLHQRKGGMAIAVRRELGIPVKFVGVGEKLGDLQPFDAAVYAKAFLE